MGWGVDFNIDIYLDRQDYMKNINLVNDKIDEIVKDIEGYKGKVIALSAATPKDIVPSDWKDEPINWLNYQIDDIFVSLNELYKQLIDLGYYRVYLEKINKEKYGIRS